MQSNNRNTRNRNNKNLSAKAKRAPTNKTLMLSKKHEVDSNMNGLSRNMKTILPPIKADPIWSFTRRYVATSAVSYSLQISDLLNSALFSTTTIVAFPIARAVRIAKIRWLTPVTTQGTTVTLSITPSATDSANNSYVSLPETYVDTSASIDKPAYLCLKPNLESPMGSWHLSTTVNKNLIDMICPTGTTMDIFFEVVANYTSVNLGYSVAIVGSAATLYVKSISNFIPQGVNAI